MCGRYVATVPPEGLADYFDAALPESTRQSFSEPSFNVAPTQRVPVITAGDQRRRVETMRWGLVPSWAKDPRIGSRLINARSETAATKPAFRAALATRRCIIPANGFYEWKPIVASKQKQPMFLQAADQSLLAMAGLWETWTEPGSHQPERVWQTCTILTTEANGAVAPVHDRMPVLLPAPKWAQWLNPSPLPASERSDLFRPAPDNYLRMHPVSTDVNSAANQGPQLCQPSAPLVNDLGF